MNWMRWNEQASERASAAGQHGLADTRHILQQGVALAEQGDQQEVDDLLLADDDAADIGAQLAGDVLHSCDFGLDRLVHSVHFRQIVPRRYGMAKQLLQLQTPNGSVLCYDYDNLLRAPPSGVNVNPFNFITPRSWRD